MAKEDISNKTVFVLAVLVVLVVAGTTWLVLNKLNGVDANNPQVVTIEKRVDYEQPSGAGEVSIRILGPPDGEGGGE